MSAELIFATKRFALGGIALVPSLRKKSGRRAGRHSNWRWHIDEVFVKINGVQHYMWRAIEHEGTVLEVYVSKRRNRGAALKILKKLMARHGKPSEIVTDKLKSYGAALRAVGYSGHHETGKRKNNQCENSHLHFRRRARHEPLSKYGRFTEIHISPSSVP